MFRCQRIVHELFLGPVSQAHNRPRVQTGKHVPVRGLAIDLATAPVMIGTLGIAAGVVAIAKGDGWWGAAGVVGGAAAVIEYYLSQSI